MKRAVFSRTSVVIDSSSVGLRTLVGDRFCWGGSWSTLGRNGDGSAVGLGAIGACAVVGGTTRATVGWPGTGCAFTRTAAGRIVVAGYVGTVGCDVARFLAVVAYAIIVLIQ